MGKRVGIIGAGVSGLAACKYLVELGAEWEVTVLEAKEKVGGVWSGDDSCYATTRLQTSKELYEFSDFRWEEKVEGNPHHLQVHRYLASYARAFHLLPCIRFSCPVQCIERADGDEGWRVRLPDGTSLHFHFLLLCCGLFSGVPRLPSGCDAFQGRLLHAHKYSRLDQAQVRKLVAGRRVLVLGFQKTAIDVAMEVAAANPQLGCTLLFRRAHWLCPAGKKVLGVPLSLLFSTRFAQLSVCQPHQGLVHSFFQLLFAPLRRLVFRLAELGLLQHYPAQFPDLVPQHTLEQDLASCILPQLPPAFFSKIIDGSITLRKSPSWTFSPTGVVLPNTSVIEADVIIMCTGYDGVAKVADLLPPLYRARLTWPPGVLPLYRGLIHPDIPDVAFLGYQEGLSSIQSSELGARWIAQFVAGKIKLPSKAAMEKDIRSWIECISKVTPFLSRLCIALLHIAHADKLCLDMGWNPMRKRNLLSDWFSPYSNADYRTPVSS